MINFYSRSSQQELLDQPSIPFGEIVKNMQELNFINRWLGGHKVTIEGFKKILHNRKQISVCEIGCGGGDNLQAIYRFCKKRNIRAEVTGIDINEDCIAFAKQNTRMENVNYITSDYFQYDFGGRSPDVIFSSLFCHHFPEQELIKMLRWMNQHSKVGFFINDLHRHPLAYHFIKLATRLFSKSYLVKNDAPLSVLRGFKKSEWKMLFGEAGISNFSIEWKWAFRHLLISPAVS